MEKVFCLNCGKELNTYTVIPEEMEIELKGHIYHYQGHEAVCPICGEPLFVPEVLKYNRDEAYKAYRKVNHIISQEDILAIPEKYHISKRNIAKYLGWGEVTFSRYCSGYIPTKQNSDILQEVFNNPSYLISRIKQYLKGNSDDESAKRDLERIAKSTFNEISINILWDSEMKVWKAASEDIQGLILESESLDSLMKNVKSVIPEFLNIDELPKNTTLDFRAERKELIFS